MIIHSIPFLSNDYVKKAISKSPCEWKEIRLDFHPQPKSLTLDVIDEKTILTLRDARSGGKSTDSLAEKEKIYQYYARSSNCLFDLEIEHKQVFLEQRLILSHHQFDEFDARKVRNIIQLSNQLPSKYLKIAISVDRYLNLLEIQQLIKQSQKPVIFVGMGKLGKISRYLYSHLGSIATYVASSEHRTAEGQLSLSEMKMTLLDKITANTKIGGLIGGNQVYHSRGIPFYNNFFRANQIDACYFPFEVEDRRDFQVWLEANSSTFQTYGFSITMPHKTKFSNLSELPAINFMHFPTHFTANTDVIAFQRSLEFLSVSCEDRILVLGSGGSAEAFLTEFHQTHSIYVCSRNQSQTTMLQAHYRFSSATKSDLEKRSFDLLINCTPIGMKGETIFTHFPLLSFQKVIDLSYGKAATPLIQYCQQEKISHVDGRLFWKWQAQKQMEYFLQNISFFSKIVKRSIR